VRTVHRQCHRRSRGHPLRGGGHPGSERGGRLRRRGIRGLPRDRLFQRHPGRRRSGEPALRHRGRRHVVDRARRHAHRVGVERRTDLLLGSGGRRGVRAVAHAQLSDRCRRHRHGQRRVVGPREATAARYPMSPPWPVRTPTSST
jgi:hypothetical protein